MEALVGSKFWGDNFTQLDRDTPTTSTWRCPKLRMKKCPAVVTLNPADQSLTCGVKPCTHDPGNLALYYIRKRRKELKRKAVYQHSSATQNLLTISNWVRLSGSLQFITLWPTFILLMVRYFDIDISINSITYIRSEKTAMLSKAVFHCTETYTLLYSILHITVKCTVINMGLC